VRAVSVQLEAVVYASKPQRRPESALTRRVALCTAAPLTPLTLNFR
jgi:hypothetical protein